jgi:hypothetical protein
MKTTSILAAALVALPLLGAGIGAVAQTPAPATAAPELSLSQVLAKLEALGYTAIGDAERDDGVWEVEATSASGVRVELDVDPVTGQVLREKPDRD